MSRVFDVGLVVLLTIGFGMIIEAMVADELRHRRIRRAVRAAYLARVGILTRWEDGTADERELNQRRRDLLVEKLAGRAAWRLVPLGEDA